MRQPLLGHERLAAVVACAGGSHREARCAAIGRTLVSRGLPERRREARGSPKLHEAPWTACSSVTAALPGWLTACATPDRRARAARRRRVAPRCRRRRSAADRPRPDAQASRIGSQDLPGALHLVVAGEEAGGRRPSRRAAASRTRRASRPRSSSRSGSPCSRCGSAAPGPGTLAPKRSRMPSSGWMRMARMFGSIWADAGAAEERQRRALELDRDLRHAAWERLAGAQVERHARPAPGVDRRA